MIASDPDARLRLAARIAEARARRAGRAAATPDAAAPAPDMQGALDGPEAGTPAENEAALAAFLQDLSGGLGLAAWPAPEARAGWAEPDRSAVLPFPRPGTMPDAAPDTPPGGAPAPGIAPAAEALDALAAALEAACDLDALPGAGPGIIWALKRAGVRRMDDLAGLEAPALAERMGPVGRLAPLERWIGVARSARA